MVTQRVSLPLAAALSAALMIPAPALAQRGLLGGLRRAVAQKVAEKAADKVGEKVAGDSASKRAAADTAAGATAAASPASGARTAGRRRGAVASTGAVAPTPDRDMLEITNERIDLLVRGLRAERERWAAVDRGSAVRDPQSTVERAAIAASGLSRRQYALLRERAQGYLATGVRPGSPWVFSAGELEVLQRRRADIAGFKKELDRISVPWTGRDWEAEAGD